MPSIMFGANVFLFFFLFLFFTVLHHFIYMLVVPCRKWLGGLSRGNPEVSRNWIWLPPESTKGYAVQKMDGWKLQHVLYIQHPYQGTIMFGTQQWHGQEIIMINTLLHVFATHRCYQVLHIFSDVAFPGLYCSQLQLLLVLGGNPLQFFFFLYMKARFNGFQFR